MENFKSFQYTQNMNIYIQWLKGKKLIVVQLCIDRSKLIRRSSGDLFLVNSRLYR